MICLNLETEYTWYNLRRDVRSAEKHVSPADGFTTQFKLKIHHEVPCRRYPSRFRFCVHRPIGLCQEFCP
jgi:hypothetical protein